MKDKDDDILELTLEELAEIEDDEDYEETDDGGSISEIYFINPDPYAKAKPRPADAPKHDVSFDEKGNIVVKNPSAFWLPELTIREQNAGTEYTVTGSYDGTETLDKKLSRIMEQNLSNAKENADDK